MEKTKRFMLIIGVTLGLPAIACMSSLPTQPNTTTNSAQVSPTPAASQIPPTDDLAKSTIDANPPAPTSSAENVGQKIITAFNKLNSSYPYRLTETWTSTDCPKEETHIVELASMLDWHSRETAGCHVSAQEVISKGGILYLRDPLINGDDGWHITDWRPPEHIAEMTISGAVKDSLYNAQLTGSETLNGVSVNDYTFDLDDLELKSTGAKVWIGAADGLLYKAQAVYTYIESGVEVNTQAAYEYGISIEIQAPVR